MDSPDESKPLPFNELVEKFRKEIPLSYGELAQRAHMSEREIRNICKSPSKHPHPDTYKKLEEALGLTVEGRQKDRQQFKRAYDATDRTHRSQRSADNPSRSTEIPAKDSRRTISWPLLLNMIAAIIAFAAPLAAHSLSQGSLSTTPEPQLSIEGWFVDTSYGDHGRSMLVSINPRTGRTRLLLPTNTVADTTFGSIVRAAYSSVNKQLAFIAEGPNGQHNLWIASLRATGTTAPRVLPPGPRELYTDCWQCQTLNWSPDGRLLLLGTPTGLREINLASRVSEPITAGENDEWPACSPDERWIAYQKSRNTDGYLVVVPADQCVPLPNAASYLPAGYIQAWHPTWSPNSQVLLYDSSAGGGGQSTFRIYAVSVGHLQTQQNAFDHPPAHQLSTAGCMDPTFAEQQHAPRLVVTYACLYPVPSLVVAPFQPAPAWYRDIPGLSASGPQPYDPIWIPDQQKESPPPAA